jgi:hypothetical protein
MLMLYSGSAVSNTLRKNYPVNDARSLQMNRNLKEAIKYICSADPKGNSVGGLLKAAALLEQEINRRVHSDPDRNLPAQMELNLAAAMVDRTPTKKVDTPQKPVHRVVQCESAKRSIVPRPSRPS